MKYIVDAHFELLTDVALRRKNRVLDRIFKLFQDISKRIS